MSDFFGLKGLRFRRGRAARPEKKQTRVVGRGIRVRRKPPVRKGSFDHVPVSVNTFNPALPLYDEEYIPEHMKGNSFIRSYYRCHYTTWQCLRSIFAVHNETGNIWTHLIGFIIVFLLSCHVLLQLGLYRTRDYCLFLLYELASLVMLGGSSMYHTFAAHKSESVYSIALALDYFGITFMIIGSFYASVFYLFSCMPVVRFVYLTTVTLLGFLGLLGPFFPFFNTIEFYWPRLILHASLTGLGILPAVHAFYGLPSNPITQPVYGGLFLTLLMYAIGMFIFIFQGAGEVVPRTL
ncbi:adiponectin receptor [Strigomonas culicis]|uniref:Adiponectin receptor n=1 Tax=Strigomonas culicis TaxID=28005 RepID=S9VUR4_9TRYP|nr:adiponectin receptor [Strigomonas culicis]|eukprot:EPY30916.1 adiponectin receptor [Strigomonas culicis]